MKGDAAFQVKTVKISHYPTNVGGLSHWFTGDTMVLVYHVITQDNVIKKSWDFINGSLSW